MRLQIRFAAVLFAALALLTSAGSLHPSIATPADMNEQVVMVKVHRGLSAVELETTLFRPAGEGPFPLVVINHGKQLGDPALQERARFLAATREFVRRGYAVALPMHQGFSKSSGPYVSAGCNLTTNGELQAAWVDSALQWLRRQPYIDAGRIVVVGQSHGGLATLALGTRKPEGVRGLVNFAGGLKYDECDWQNALVSAAESYGKRATLPSLWFYGDNDSHFPAPLWKEMHARYSGAGGRAQMVAFGRFGADAHLLFPSHAGVPVWVPQVEKFLQALDLPSRPTVSVSEPPRPRRTDFAPLADAAAVPHMEHAGRDAYAAFLQKPAPRAFAVSSSGSWGWASEGDEPVALALAGCQQHTRKPCRLYAIDNDVVWRP
jgi:dienelactone hydrolase